MDGPPEVLGAPPPHAFHMVIRFFRHTARINRTLSPDPRWEPSAEEQNCRTGEASLRSNSYQWILARPKRSPQNGWQVSRWRAYLLHPIDCLRLIPVFLILIIYQDHLFPWATASKGFWCSKKSFPFHICKHLWCPRRQIVWSSSMEHSQFRYSW